MRHKVCLFLMVGVAGLLWAVPSDANPACERVPLTGDAIPGWTVSGAWSPDGQKLVLVDTLNNRLLTYEDQAQISTGSTRIAAEDLGQPFLPSALVSTADGLLLEMANAHYVELQSNGQLQVRPGEAVKKLTGAKRGGLSAEFFFAWTLAGPEVVAFSDFEVAGAWSSGFVRVPLSHPAAFRVLTRSKTEDPNRLFYRLGHQLLTAGGTNVYAIVMGEKPGLYRSSQDSERLVQVADLPAPFNQRPHLPGFKTTEDFRGLMKAVERSSLPTGLFFWEDALYIVGRVPSAGGTQWWLTRLDPATGRVLGSAQLKTTANHLTVVPGPQSWAFVEKGLVRGFGDQRIESILVVPAVGIRGVGKANTLCD